MSDSVRPHRWQPTRVPRPWDSPGKNTGVGCRFPLQCGKVKVKSLSRVRLLATPWTAAYQAPPSMGFARQEYWSWVSFVLLHSTILQKGRLRHHMVIWLTRDCRKEPVFKSMSLPWYMHKILIIMCLIKMIRKHTGPLQ